MKNEKTSGTVASKAARVLKMIPDMHKALDETIGNLILLRHLLLDMQSVAGSVLTQTPDKEKKEE